MSMNSDREPESPPPGGVGGTGKPPAYVVFKQRQKEVSLARPLLLAGLMLLAVALLAPAIQLLRVQEERGVRVDEVEERELEPPPELPEPGFVPSAIEWPEIPDPFGGERRPRPEEPFRVRSEELFRDLLRNEDTWELGLRLRVDTLDLPQQEEPEIHPDFGGR